MNSETKKLLIIDLTKVAVIAVTYHLLYSVRKSSPLFSENFFFELSFLLCGVVAYYVMIHKHIVDKTDKMIN